MPLVEGILAGILATGATSGTSKGYRAVREWLREDAPVDQEFEDALAERIDDRAAALDSRALTNVFHHWETLTTDIDTADVVLDTEDEALDWLVNQIADHDGITLDDEERQELRTVLADEYADAMKTFYERVRNDEELREQFEMELGLETLERVQSIADRFERLAGSQAYDLYEFPDERQAIIDRLLPGDRIPFAERSEVPATPQPDRYFILGPSGSGKTRIIAEFVERLPDDAISQVLVPNQRFLDQSDARELGRQSFDGDLLLVWDDLHKVEAGEDSNLVERTLRELATALDTDRELYTLLEARSGRLDAISTTLTDDFENDNSMWVDYEPLWVGTVAESSLGKMIDDRVSVAESNAGLTEDAREALVERTRDVASAPQYIKTVITAAEGRLTAEDIEAMPEDVASLWRQKPYPKLRENSPEEWDVLVAMKMLYDLDVPAFSKLVHAVYLEYIGGDFSLFESAIEQLVNRQWLTIIGDDLLALETRYDVHDTQLEAIQLNAADRSGQLSDFLLDEVDNTVPEVAHASVHLYSGLSFVSWDDHSLAKKQWEASIKTNPDFAEAHYNYALLLTEELDTPTEAADYYEQAIEQNPNFSEAHNNYALLLFEELNAVEKAADHFERVIEINPENAEAFCNYSKVLRNGLDAPEKAADYLETALDLWFSSTDPISLRRAVKLVPPFAGLCKTCDRSERGVEYCERALKYLSEFTRPQAQQFEPVLRVRHAQLSARKTTERLPELYWYGLLALRDQQLEPAADLLTDTWSLRSKADDASHYLAVSAGVWCVALPTADIDAEVVKQAVETVDTARSPVVSALVTAFFTDETPPVPMQVRQNHSLTDHRHQHELRAWESLLQLD